MIKYNIDSKSGTIRAILSVKDSFIGDRFYDKKSFIGIAKCNPEDEYNEELGMEIARKRCLIKYYEKEIEGRNKQINHFNEIITSIFSKNIKSKNKLAQLKEELRELV